MPRVCSPRKTRSEDRQRNLPCLGSISFHCNVNLTTSTPRRSSVSSRSPNRPGPPMIQASSWMPYRTPGAACACSPDSAASRIAISSRRRIEAGSLLSDEDRERWGNPRCHLIKRLGEHFPALGAVRSIGRMERTKAEFLRYLDSLGSYIEAGIWDYLRETDLATYIAVGDMERDV